MKKLSFFVILLALTQVSAGHCSETRKVWKDMSSGIDEINLKTVAYSPMDENIIYAGSQKCVFKSSNAGKTWDKVYQQTGVNTVSPSASDKATVYVGTQNGLFQSRDGGSSWKRIFEGMGPGQKDIRHMAIAPADGGTIYIGTEDGLLMSRDSGKSWSKSTGEISGQIISFISIRPDDSPTIYVAASTGVFKSRDAGLSWVRIFFVKAQTGEGQEEEASGSNDADENISYSNKAPNCIAIDPKDTNRIYIGTNSGVFVSYDTGMSFTKITSNGLMNKKVNSLAFLDEKLYAATRGGVFTISQNGPRWEDISQGLLSRDVRCISCSQKYKFILAATKNGLYKMRPEVPTECTLSPPLPETGADINKIFSHFENEPTIQETQQAAIKYAEVQKEKIDRWRKDAKQKAILPNLSASAGRDLTDYYHWDSGTSPDTLQRGKDAVDWAVTVSWDLGDLIWNDDQTSIDARSRLLVQLRDDILDEITQLYFERRRLQIELLTDPPKTLQNKLEKELKLQKLTAGIDALTGGWFSKKLSTAVGDV